LKKGRDVYSPPQGGGAGDSGPFVFVQELTVKKNLGYAKLSFTRGFGGFQEG